MINSGNCNEAIHEKVQHDNNKRNCLRCPHNIYPPLFMFMVQLHIILNIPLEKSEENYEICCSQNKCKRIKHQSKPPPSIMKILLYFFPIFLFLFPHLLFHFLPATLSENKRNGQKYKSQGPLVYELNRFFDVYIEHEGPD